MTPELQGFALVFRTNHSLLTRALEGVTDEQALERPDGANPIHWIAGHTVTTRALLGSAIGCDVEVPWGGHFRRGGEVKDESSWPPLAEVRAKWDEVHEAFMKALETLTPERLSAKTKVMGLSDDVLGVVALAAVHDGYHVGQIAAARRRFGLARLLG